MPASHIVVAAIAGAQAVDHLHDIAAELLRIMADDIRLIDDVRREEADAERVDGLLVDFDRISAFLGVIRLHLLR